jgi:hypothetical protein
LGILGEEIMDGGSVNPPRERPRSTLLIPHSSHHSGREVVIKRVVEKASMLIVYPVLTCMNYSEWALVMHVNLQAVGLCDTINKGSNNYCDEWNALVVLLWVIPPEMQAGLAAKEIAKEAIHSIWVGVAKVKKANAEKLRREFDDIAFKSSECVEEFSMHISSLANQLR